ncbi:TPA: hypothetical protein OM995_001198 [Pseudomonas aeruginosa]|nr:hypothetical protein [Pseudomonas aeruginosa]HCF1774319.1 hypothetical protein [Pseudomonas aeruginosa]HCF6827489.1 hypothetical protein [Pseudomonas aeruginosa]HCR1180523.1 hypothetical protein [Pseudomonas aeruginosa]
MNASAITLLAAAVAAAASLPATAQTPTPKQNTMTSTATASSVASLIPATHREIGRHAVTVDGETAELTRHERRDGRNTGLEGEHFSTVVASDGTLKGFANMSLDLVGKPLPSRERTEAIARTFLQSHAPELLPRMQISWIEPHDEPLRVQREGRAETLTLTGMKVKARNLADGRWFWVIVGADERPMVFERDIVWINFPGHRKTEKWLHDAWLKEQGQTVGKST